MRYRNVVKSAAGRFVVPADLKNGSCGPFSRDVGVHRYERGRHSQVTRIFSKWQPPAGAEFKGFYGLADGSGGVAPIEAESADALARTTVPWTPWLRFTSNPIGPIEDSSAIAGEAVAFRDSVS